MSSPPHIYVNKLNRDQASRLHALLLEKGWQMDAIAHAQWRAKKEKTTIVAYDSGKLVVQGKETAEIVQFMIEPEILGEVRFGYEEVLAERENPEMFEPHIGIDESGKGDYFGPLSVAAVYVNAEFARKLLSVGVQDSKRIHSDRRIAALADQIKEIVGGHFSLVTIGPESYNRLYDSVGNLNRLLAWGHAKTLENVLEKVPECPRAISDKFAHESVIRNALQKNGRRIKLVQIVRAEADVAVAAASVLARAEFVGRLQELSEKVGLKLPKGAGPPVLEAAIRLVETQGADIMSKVAKLHFKTTARVLSSGTKF